MKYMLAMLAMGAVTAGAGAATVLERLESRAQAWEKDIPALRSSASAAAGRIIAGGKLYVAGPQKSFAPEANTRVGGMMLTLPYNANRPLTSNDVVLAASATADTAELTNLFQRTGASGAMLILFSAPYAGGKNIECPENVTVFPKMPLPKMDADSALSIESVANVMGLWAWTAEFIAACVEQGRMPGIYESFWLPGGRDRFDVIGKAPFHTVTDVRPADAKRLSRRILERIAQSVRRTRTENGPAFARAAELIRAAHAAGGAVRVVPDSHMFPSEMLVPQNPEWIAPAQAADKPGPADVALVLGYQAFPWKLTQSIAKDGSACVLTCSHTPAAEFLRGDRNVYINPFWDFTDAALDLPGYDARLFPLSGIMQAAVYWQLIEDVTK